MAKDRDDQLNQGTDGGGENTDFSLEEILAEFGEKPRRKSFSDDTIPFPIIPKSARAAPAGRKPGRVVVFPTGGAASAPAPPATEDPALGPELLEEVQPAPKAGRKSADKKIVEFPGEEPNPPPASDNPIAEGLNRLVRKADQYAEHMFGRRAPSTPKRSCGLSATSPAPTRRRSRSPTGNAAGGLSRLRPRTCPRQNWSGGTRRDSRACGFGRCWLFSSLPPLWPSPWPPN